MSFYYGADFYPEHWPSSTWENQALLMQSAGINVVRLAEFAWVMMEPREGHFEFQWLDNAIEVLHRHGIAVVLGTPTAAMPAWLKEKYPDVMASTDGHHRDAWGVRKNNCFTSPIYRRLSQSITSAMAEHYMENPGVIGWQTDNEIDGPYCKCAACVEQFASFLEQKYGSLDRLNRAWGTHFWGQLYTSWKQLQAPGNVKHDNPSLCLDWFRFNTMQQVTFQAEQVEIIRAANPNHFITHNYMGFGNYSNTFDLAKDMDFASFDSYPGFPASPDWSTAYHTSISCDLTRGLKSKNFWIMETTAGPTGWGEFSRAPRPGEMRKTLYQHVAHGADGQIFFRWQSCTAGREQYWHGLLGHDGKPGRRYNEAKSIGAELKSIGSVLEGTTVDSKVAIIFDYDSRWATDIQGSFTGNNYIENIRRYYDAFRRAGVDVDIIQSDADFSKYALVAALELYVLPDSVAHRLNTYVESGGVMLVDLRTGVKDESSLCYARTLPGLLTESLGIQIDEYEAVPGEYSVTGTGTFDGEYVAVNYADWIRPTSAETLASYGDWHVKEFAAVTRNGYGKGLGWYVGAQFKEDRFYDKLATLLLRDASVAPLMIPPMGVEVSVRRSESKTLLFIINHKEEEVKVVLPRALTDLLTGQTLSEEISMARFGVHIFELTQT